jgi:phosphoglycolate phosphatase-like HAD superfamily hydrolase
LGDSPHDAESAGNAELKTIGALCRELTKGDLCWSVALRSTAIRPNFFR